MMPRAHGEAGGIYFELLIVFLPVMTLALGVLQLAELYSAKFSLDHAAANAARSASVVFADDPKFYRSGDPEVAKTKAVRTAAARALAPFILDGSIRTVDVSFPKGISQERGAEITVEVRSTYRCGVPLVQRIVCASGSGQMELASRGTFSSTAADFVY
jgi:hypothetical protein